MDKQLQEIKEEIKELETMIKFLEETKKEKVYELLLILARQNLRH